ncbi:MAG TPA: ABC transporter permease subunit [Candidatus Sumerlaeota bacterium]|nr:ABC transporter permease subunit [Candidatus Sumerlaeota bacterium]HPK01786.1 ABC transporter permease subunit [Candidatus Sumerlaeota bacterium]
MSLAAQETLLSMETPRGPRPWGPLARAAWIQAVRRSEIHVLLILLGLYGLAALILRLIGIESAQTARFIAGLGLQLGSCLAMLLVIILIGRQVPTEIDQRTIYPMLAKPVSRMQLLLGKALPIWLAGVAALGLFVGVTLLITPRLPIQHPVVLAEALVLRAGGLAMAGALAMWLSLRLPMAVAMLATAAAAFFGGMAGNFAAQAGGRLGALAARFIPDFSLLDQFQRYVDGGRPLSLAEIAGLLLYAALWTFLFSVLAGTTFRRMAL